MQIPELSVLYDGGCPLCSREIRHYQGLDGKHRIRWLDVTQEGPELAAMGIARTDALAALYVIDAHGQVFKGVAGFVRLWAAIPRYRWLARLIPRLGLLPALEWVYRHFARWHYRWRCGAEACATTPTPDVSNH